MLPKVHMDQSNGSIIKLYVYYYIVERLRIGARLVLEKKAGHSCVLDSGSLVHFVEK